MKEIVVESEWGTISSNDSNILTKTVSQSLKQLKSYRDQGNKTEYLKRDIEGYEMLLACKDQEYHCEEFLELKQNRIMSGMRFKDNLAVIKEMKETKIWRK